MLLKISLWLIILSQVAVPAGNSRQRIYKEIDKKGETIHRFTFVALESGQKIRLESVSRNKKIIQIYRVDHALSTLRWEYIDPTNNSRIEARLENRVIRLEGIHKGDAIRKQFKINDLPWNQVFHIGLEPFARSGGGSTQFWSIGTSGPGEMKIAKFNVKRIKTETISIEDRETKACRLQISLSGLLSVFWKGYYWYRQEDGCFLLYREKGKQGDNDPLMVLLDDQ